FDVRHCEKPVLVSFFQGLKSCIGIAEFGRQNGNKMIVRFTTSSCSLFLPFHSFAPVTVDTGAHIGPFETGNSRGINAVESICFQMLDNGLVISPQLVISAGQYQMCLRKIWI